jgi:hypothetical protein
VPLVIEFLQIRFLDVEQYRLDPKDSFCLMLANLILFISSSLNRAFKKTEHVPRIRHVVCQLRPVLVDLGVEGSYRSFVGLDGILTLADSLFLPLLEVRLFSTFLVAVGLGSRFILPLLVVLCLGTRVLLPFSVTFGLGAGSILCPSIRLWGRLLTGLRDGCGQRFQRVKKLLEFSF